MDVSFPLAYSIAERYQQKISQLPRSSLTIASAQAAMNAAIAELAAEKQLRLYVSVATGAVALGGGALTVNIYFEQG